MANKVDHRKVCEALDRLERTYGIDWDMNAPLNNPDYRLIIKYRLSMGIITRPDRLTEYMVKSKRHLYQFKNRHYVAINGQTGKIAEAKTLNDLGTQINYNPRIISSAKFYKTLANRKWLIMDYSEYVKDPEKFLKLAKEKYAKHVKPKKVSKPKKKTLKQENKLKKQAKIMKKPKAKKINPKSWIAVNGRTFEVIYAQKINGFTNRFGVTAPSIRAMRHNKTLIRGEWKIWKFEDNLSIDEMKKDVHEAYVKKENYLKNYRFQKRVD